MVQKFKSIHRLLSFDIPSYLTACVIDIVKSLSVSELSEYREILHNVHLFSVISALFPF